MKKAIYNRHFPTPRFLAMTSCALDISDQSIKYGELYPTSQGLRLGRFGKIKVPPGVIVSGKIQNEDELVVLLKELRVKENLSFVRVSLPEEQMYLFTLSFPKVVGANLRETILLSLEEHIPLSASDALFDFEVISENASSVQVEVAAIAALTIETYLSVFERSGFTPLSFELEAQAIARAVIPRGEEDTVMTVDFGETRTGISIADHGRVLFTSTLDMGGAVLTDMVAKNFNVSFEEAEKMKKAYGPQGASKAEEIFPIILNGLSVLRDELNKHYVYWHTHEEENGIKHPKINRIILCGGDANLAGLAEYLEASMKVKVVYASAWTNISEVKNSIPDMTFEESLGFVTTLGLALGDYIYD